LTGNSIFQ